MCRERGMVTVTDVDQTAKVMSPVSHRQIVT